MTFDIVEPKEFIIGGDVLLSVEIWDDSAWSDDLLASVELSALRYALLSREGRPSNVHQRIPILIGIVCKEGSAERRS